MADQHNEFAGVAHTVIQVRDWTVQLPRSVGKPPNQLPPSVRLVDRKPYLTLLDQAGPAGKRFYVIGGTPGIGKSALVVHWAHSVAERFPDGKLFANLRGYDPAGPARPEAVLTQFLRSLHVPEGLIQGDLDALAATWRTHAHGLKLLVVLDNAADFDQIAPLLPGSPTCVVVVTSRRRLPGLVSRYGAEEVDMEVLDEDHAVALLADVIGQDRVAAEPDSVRELAALCARLPLALRVAAERVHAEEGTAIAELVADLRDDFAREDAFGEVWPVFAWSYDVLPDAAALVFRRMVLHPGRDVGVDALAVLVGGAPRTGLGPLTQGSLVAKVRDRYSMHDLLRDYALRLAREVDGDEVDAARSRLVEWYVGKACAARDLLHPFAPALDGERVGFADRAAALAWLAAERGNLVDVVRLAGEVGRPDLAWRLASALSEHFHMVKAWPEWIETHRIGVAAAEGAERARLRASLATALRESGRRDEALALYEEALAEAGPGGRVDALIGRSYTHREGREHEQAVEYGRRAVDDARPGFDQGRTLNNLAGALAGLGEFAEALEVVGQALAIFGELGDERGRAWAIHVRGEIHWARGELGAAERDFREALAIREGVDGPFGVAVTLRELGRVLLDAGADGRPYLRRAAEIAERGGFPFAAEVRAMVAD